MVINDIVEAFKPITVYADTGKNDGVRALQSTEVEEGWKHTFLNQSVIDEFGRIPYVRVGLILLIIVLTVIIIWRVIGIRSILTGAAVDHEKSVRDKIKLRDSIVLQSNSFMKKITDTSKHVGVSNLSEENRNYLKYNLERADVRVPGGHRYMTPEEYTALCQLTMLVGTTVGLILAVFVNIALGMCIIVSSILGVKTIPMIMIRITVTSKDNEIREHFPDLYLMVHYELMADSGTPLGTTFKSFSRITNNKEMQRFIESCINLFDTYGEIGATQYIARQYREIPEITRLMRLIKQQSDGGDIKSELVGFRKQIIADKEYRLNEHVDKMVAKASLSINLVLIILAQAIISAMAVYLPDLGVMNFG